MPAFAGMTRKYAVPRRTTSGEGGGRQFTQQEVLSPPLKSLPPPLKSWSEL
jgi:hypothetical protein